MSRLVLLAVLLSACGADNTVTAANYPVAHPTVVCSDDTACKGMGRQGDDFVCIHGECSDLPHNQGFMTR
jgi:hypothetical protein